MTAREFDELDGDDFKAKTVIWLTRHGFEFGMIFSGRPINHWDDGNGGVVFVQEMGWFDSLSARIDMWLEPRVAWFDSRAKPVIKAVLICAAIYLAIHVAVAAIWH
jgi:hypothetical protein